MWEGVKFHLVNWDQILSMELAGWLVHQRSYGTIRGLKNIRKE
jgi:hypothetical protein